MSRSLIPIAVGASLFAGAVNADVPSVVADITPIHSLVAQVMQGVGEPSLIVAPGASAHEYSLRPSEASALQDADVVFWVGPELTPWLEDAVATLAGDASVIGLFDLETTTVLPVRENALFEAHDHDHGAGHAEAADHEVHDGHDHASHDDDHAAQDQHGSEHVHAEETKTQDHDDRAHSGHDEEDHAGHEHAGNDPHAWLSPKNGAVWLTAIADALASADPDNAAAYHANAAAARDELTLLSAEINMVLDPVRGRNFVVFHDAYQYFEAAFDFPASGAISVSDASDPSPARISEIQDHIADRNISCVLSEPQFDPGIVSAVVDGSGAQTGVLDPLGADLEPGPEFYRLFLRRLATSLADCL
ncbi:MAG TPA: zinc ABC transporter substrate-binding protein [Roseovarius sp.]|uniref:zinc ABC transporter substrate-binding protein n=1 Tax=Marivita sp. TaxID=2003365 RepID=UPI0025B97185|nr:zinc ABC transporter substrate-binding protein [Marivita sp.]HKL45155.1 zinc ABC transporter substrate-binding protein [Roseovarius sp.]